MDFLEANNKNLNLVIIKTNNRATRFDVIKGGLQVKLAKNASISYIKEYLTKYFNKFYQLVSENQKYYDRKDYTLIFDKEYQIIYTKLKDKYLFCNNILYMRNTLEYKYDLILKQIKTEMLTNYLMAINMQIRPDLEALGIKPVAIKVKALYTKFAYCNITDKEIVFSLFCVKLPPEIIKHILYHEYTHFLVRGHNKEFYNILGKLDKNAKINNKLIKGLRINKEE